MASDRNLTPPNWQKDAVATAQGWKHPKTGELLVSYKGLDKILGEMAKPAPAKKATKKVAEVEVEVETVEEPTSEE